MENHSSTTSNNRPLPVYHARTEGGAFGLPADPVVHVRRVIDRNAKVLAAKVAATELKRATGVPDSSPEYWELQRQLSTLLEVATR